MKIGIVNDVNMAVHILSSLIKEKTTHEVVWTAYNGLEAVEKCRQCIPDIILMDLIMPVMDGVQATNLIMKETPCAILIVTSSVVGNLHKVFEAMGHGALDVVKTPSLEIGGGHDTSNELLIKIETIGMLIGKVPSRKGTFPVNKAPLERKQSLLKVPPLFVIGASTGGPMAIAKILAAFPKDVPFASIIIQHINQDFVPGLIHWLNQQSSLKVTFAEEGMLPEKGKVYLPASAQHLVFTQECTFKYFSPKELCTFQPSVDVFFSSAAKYWPIRSVGALLTGMGVDGAQGLKELNNAGWYTIAEDKKTCVVFGMPKAACELGAASVILPIDKIADAVVDRLRTVQ